MLVLLAVILVPVLVGLLMTYLSYDLTEKEYAQTYYARVIKHASDIDQLYDQAMHTPTSYNVQSEYSDMFDDDQE